MAAAANKRNPQKICFFDWLVNEINSRKYEGLYWVDEAHTTFRIPWKHNSRKDLVADDYMIFKAWAVVSRKYNERLPDPSRWKTNFRCALKSTKRFEEVKSNDPDYHEYKIIPLSTAPAANPPPGTSTGSDHGNDDLHISPTSEGVQGFDQTTSPFQQEIAVAFKTLSLDNPVPGPNGNTVESIYQCSGDTLQWVMQQAALNLEGIQPVSWAPTPGDHVIEKVYYQQSSACADPPVDQNGYQPLRNEAVGEAVENSYYEEPSRWLARTRTDVNSQSAATLGLQQAQQNLPATNHLNHLDVLGQKNCFVENVYMDEEPVGNGVMICNTASQHPMMEQSACTLPGVLPVGQPPVNAAPLQNNTGLVSFGLDVSIYYRGRLLCETRVEANSCLFTYNNNHHTQMLDNPHIIQFPNPTMLPDQKQVQHTLTVLQNIGLLLYRQNEKLCAKRLGKCKVFWAFSKQLDNMAQHPEPKVLQREVEVEIFNYEKFGQELQQFHYGQRKSSPDYTIYLCFGQCFSVARPKESKLILVKLVPVFCKYWHEHVLREGASSLNSEIESLQFSNSLVDMMEYLSNICMQSEVVH